MEGLGWRAFGGLFALALGLAAALWSKQASELEALALRVDELEEEVIRYMAAHEALEEDQARRQLPPR